MSSNCVFCDREVRPRQHAIQCDACQKWQHRVCDSGISLSEYRNMVKGQLELDWLCCNCTPSTFDNSSSSAGSPSSSLSINFVPETPAYYRGDLSVCSILIPQTPPSPEMLVCNPAPQPLPRRARPVPIPRQRPTVVLRNPSPSPTRQASPPVPEPRPVPAPRRRPVPAPRRRLLPTRKDEDTDEEINALEENLHGMSINNIDELRFEILPKASRSNRNILVDNRGYTYNLKRTLANGRDWQCAVRQKSNYCSASVKEHGDTFTFGKQEHCHEGASSVTTAKRITAKVKEESLGNVFVSAGTIAEQVLYAMCDAELPPQSRPKLSNLTRLANRTREKLRPKEPQDCDFEIAEGYIPLNFLQADIRQDEQRHLVFATQEQLTILADLQSWYIDGTFKVVRNPFVQLFSVHGFLGNEQKQVPLLFVLMSRRQTTDYIKTRYNNERQIYEIVRQVLALPFLPVQEVPGAFQYIKTLTDDEDDRLGDLLMYIERNWVDSSTFPIPTWNVFRVATRTNNDYEGWHRRLNHYARDAIPPFYVLVPLLFEEAKKVPPQRQRVTEGTLSRLQRREVRERQERYNTLWDDYEDGALNGIELLCEIARICGPSRL